MEVLAELCAVGLVRFAPEPVVRTAAGRPAADVDKMRRERG